MKKIVNHNYIVNQFGACRERTWTRGVGGPRAQQLRRARAAPRPAPRPQTHCQPSPGHIRRHTTGKHVKLPSLRVFFCLILSLRKIDSTITEIRGDSFTEKLPYLLKIHKFHLLVAYRDRIADFFNSFIDNLQLTYKT